MILDRIIEVDGWKYVLFGKITYEGELITLEYSNERMETIKHIDLKTYIRNGNSINAFGTPISEDL